MEGNGGNMAGKPVLEGLAGITWAPLQRGAALPKEYKHAMSHQNLRSGLKVLAFLCIALARVMLISAQSAEVFSLWFMGSLF